MRKYIITLLAIGDTTFLGYSQTKLGLSLPHSPISSPEENAFFLLRENPSYIHLMAVDSSFISHEPIFTRLQQKKNNVSSDFHMVNVSGDYLFHKGNQEHLGGVHATGEKSYKQIGTLYGSASYMRKGSEQVLLNYAIHPEDYYPYLIADTMGAGKISQEIYHVEGGFGFCHQNTYWGIHGEYEGIVASKLTDPKLSAYNSWFRLKLGMSTFFGKHLFSAYLAPELNKQTISAGSYKHSPVKYFQFYGFGEWSRKESKAGYSYGRMMGIKGIKTNMTLKRKLNQATDFNYLADLSYHFQHMKTEEDSYKNLFATQTHRINGFLMLSKRYPHWIPHLIYSGGYVVRNGTESIYENKEVSEEQSLYDYTKVGENKLYKLSESYSEIIFKAIHHFRLNHEIHYAIGSKYLFYKETYLSPHKEVSNQTISPSASVTYKVNIKRQLFEFYSHWEHKLSLSSKFENSVSLRDNPLIVQQSYIPYLIRGESAHLFQVEARYGYSLRNQHIIGGNIQFSHYFRTHSIDEYQLGSQHRKQSVLSCSLFYFF